MNAPQKGEKNGYAEYLSVSQITDLKSHCSHVAKLVASADGAVAVPNTV